MNASETYEQLLGTKKEIISSLRRATGCDITDVLTAVACGSIGGMIDVFLVGAPGDGKPLEAWSDSQVDNAVKKFAEICGWDSSDPDKGTVAYAIDHLEKMFKVNYDQRYGADVGGLFDMSTTNHHMKSLAHSPSPVGLFFSVLNQFTSTASFVSDGELITVRTDLYDPVHPNGKDSIVLQGHTVESKLFCGIANWIGHIMSDVAGSSLTRRRAGDGSGVAIPFFELFQFCKSGDFDVDGRRMDVAELSIKVFQDGYDARFALGMGIPVVITDLSIKLVWALKRHFGKGEPFKNCIPSSRHDDLRTMLLIGNSAFCLIDGADAFARSGGGMNAALFAERLNYLAWLRLASLCLREVAIRTSLEREVAIMKEVNAALESYLEELRTIDVDAFNRELSTWSVSSEKIEHATSESELNAILMDEYERLGISKPWKGSFDKHMADKTAFLVFE